MVRLILLMHLTGLHANVSDIKQGKGLWSCLKGLTLYSTNLYHMIFNSTQYRIVPLIKYCIIKFGIISF